MLLKGTDCHLGPSITIRKRFLYFLINITPFGHPDKFSDDYCDIKIKHNVWKLTIILHTDRPVVTSFAAHLRPVGGCKGGQISVNNFNR